MILSSIPVAEVVLIAWNREPVQVIYQSSSWTTVKPLHGGEKRDISTACKVLPYDEKATDSVPVILPQSSRREITFKDFAAVAKKRGNTAESLAERFRGKIENPSEFFDKE